MYTPETDLDGLEVAGDSAIGDVVDCRPRRDAGPACLVVMYHYVHDGEALPAPGLQNVPPGIGGLSSRDFQIQLDRLCKHLEPINWPRLYAWTCGRGSIPDRCFLLTFDDGLADHAANVMPVLRKRGLRGVFFVPGAILTSVRLLPAHAFHLLLGTLDERTLECDLLRYLAEHDESGTDWMEAVDLAAAGKMYDYESPQRARLKYLLTITLPIKLRAQAIEALFEQHIGSLARWAQHWYLGWDELVEMQSAGHTIGGHGYWHEPYGRLTRDEHRDDLRRVAAVLRNGLGSDIRPFSYAYGQHDHFSRAACREMGFAHAFSTQRDWVTKDSDVLCLPRVDTIRVDEVLESELACAGT